MSFLGVFGKTRPPDAKEGALENTLGWTDDKGRVLSYDDLIHHVKSEFDRRRKERHFLELQWQLNVNFKNDNQYCDINWNTGRIEETRLMYWFTEREVHNHIAPTIETRMAKLKRLNVSLKTRPASNDRNDLSAARVTNKIFESIASDKSLRDLQAVANAWAETCGTVFWRNGWNAKAGNVVGEYRVEGEEPRVTYMGDLEIEVVPPHEIYPETLQIMTIEGQPSIIRAKALSVQEIEDNWGKKVEPESIDTYIYSGSDYTGGGALQRSSAGKYSVSRLDSHALVMEYYEKPTQKYPEGRLIICTRIQLLYAGNLPLPVGEGDAPGYPFVLQKCTEIEGQFFGKAIIDRLIPLQRRYNAIRNRKAEYLNRCTIGNFVAEEGSVDADHLEQNGIAPGDIILVKRGTQLTPSFMQYPPLPSTFEEEAQAIMSDFYTISGVSEISRDSSAPTGANSGLALQILQEQDDTRLSITAENIKSAMIRCAKQWVRILRKYADEERMVKTVGKNSRVDVLSWKGSDLTSDDIYIEAQTLLSETLAQRRQMVFDLLKSGLFIDPETGGITKEGRSKVFELLELGNWEDFDDEDNSNLHLQKAHRENRLMLNGEYMEPAEFDDELLHISRHNAFRLTAEYEELKNTNPEIAALIDQHVEAHIASLQMKAATQAPAVQEEEGVVNDGDNEPNAADAPATPLFPAQFQQQA